MLEIFAKKGFFVFLFYSIVILTRDDQYHMNSRPLGPAEWGGGPERLSCRRGRIHRDGRKEAAAGTPGGLRPCGLAGAGCPCRAALWVSLPSCFCLACTQVPRAQNQDWGLARGVPMSLMAPDGSAPPGRCLPTYQEEHPLLQALPGELEEAALADELLEDRGS